MRSRVFATIALLLAFASGCATAPPQPKAATSPEPLTPLLWKAERPGSQLYLFGSVHAGDASMARFWPRLQEAYEASEEIAMELVPSEIDRQATRAFLAAHGTLEPPDSLEARLGPALFERLAAAFAGLGVPRANLQRMAPWLLVQLVMIDAALAEGHRPEQGVEQVITDRMSDGPVPARPLVALESVETQLMALAGLPDAVQAGLLESFLAGAGAGGPHGASAVIAAWARGDEQALTHLITPGDPLLAAFYEHVILRRNEQMSQRLLELSADGRTRLVVVGVLHMVGPSGIPARLEAEGYAVERLSGP